MPLRATQADWAATVPWNGIQGVPPTLAGVQAANPPQITVVVPLAKLTTMGTFGSLTVQNGLIIRVDAPT